MVKPILLVRVNPEHAPIENLEGWLEGVKNDYIILVLADLNSKGIALEYPKNCDLPISDLERIKEGIVLIRDGKEQKQGA